MVRATNMEIGIMANEKQLAILARGVAAWNEWRLENPEASIDFKRANTSTLIRSPCSITAS